MEKPIKAVIKSLINPRQLTLLRQGRDSVKSLRHARELPRYAVRFGTDKIDRYHTFNGLSYIDLYERYLSKFRKKHVSLLEIGVLNGASLRMWKHYFRRGNIYGLDINLQAKQHEEPRVQIWIGSQTDDRILKKLSEDAGGFDIVIDDGSHVNRHMVASFNALYENMRPGGVYVIEDLHCSYLKLDEVREGSKTGVRELWPGMALNSATESLNNDRNELDMFFNTLIHHMDHGDRRIKSVHFWANICFIEKA
jgi:hypothetical protein